MQKKHLHLLPTILLLLVLEGCGDSHVVPENPYISGKKKLNSSISIGESQRLAWGALTAELFSPNAGTPLLLSATIDGRTQIRFALEGSPRGTEDSLIFERSLTGLALRAARGGNQISLSPLPDGEGFVVTLDGWGGASSTLTADFWAITSEPTIDEPLLPNWADAAKGLLVWPDDRLGNIAIGVAPQSDQLTAAIQADRRLRIPLPPASPQQIVVACGDRYSDSVERVRQFLGREAAVVARATLDTLNASAAFSLTTSDDRTNQAAALLLARLVRANRHPLLVNEQSLERDAELAVGMFLAARERPGAVIPGFNPWIDAQISHFDPDVRLFWSAEACRAVMTYGMLTGDALTEFQSELLAAITRIDESYRRDLSIITDPGITDSLIQRSVSHLRFSSFLELGEQISKDRGQNTAQSAFRGRSLDATKAAQRAFDASARIYRSFLQGQQQSAKRPKAEDEIDPLDLLDESSQTPPTYPDTVALVRAGARFGFKRMDSRPSEFLASRAAWDSRIWQSWVGFRFRDENLLAETSDYDSLITVLLEGPVPGSLTDFRNDREEPSLSGTAAALRNLSEVYLGIRPNWITNTVEIAPRPPVSWGRTSARVPLAEGFLRVEYDFVEEIAFIGVEEIKEDLKILFRYPLPSSAALTAQFILSPDKPTVKIHVERDRGNRMILEVDKASW